MKKIIVILLAIVLFSCGCAIPAIESSSVVSETESAPESKAASEDVVDSMTQAEFDDFFETKLPAVCLLFNGQQDFDPDQVIEENGRSYYKIIDQKYNTVDKLKAAFSKYFTPEYVENDFDLFLNLFRYGVYFEYDGVLYVNEKTAGATRKFNADTSSFSIEDDCNFFTTHTVQNGQDPFANYLLMLKRVNGEWMVSGIQCAISEADEDPTVWMGKPVIYLYPEAMTDVMVKLDLNGTLGCTYPAYPKDGWKVTAYPNGKLIVGGEEYDYLFWEGDLNTVFTFDKGFCVKGSDTAAFLKKALSEMGLIPSEYNDFIVYWLPKMEGNAYNLISFIGKEYTDNAKLNITPKPDSVLRVAMAYQPLEKPITIAPQTFEKFERNGFTVVEWGGAEID